MVVYSKEMPQACGNCEAKLQTAFFRCVDCGEVVSCPNCDPRGSCDKENVTSSGPIDGSFCPRGGFGSRGRSFRDHSSHPSCLRGGFAPRERHFYSRPESPYDRPNFAAAAPFPELSRGCGFGPRGFGGFSSRCPFPETFGPMAEDFSPMMMHGRGGFAPFAGASRGRAGFSRGVPEMGMARGRGGCRGRGALRPFCGSTGMGSGECNHESVLPEKVNIKHPSGEPCPGAVGSDHEENTPTPRGEPFSRAGGSHDKENVSNDTQGGACTEQVNVDHEG